MPLFRFDKTLGIARDIKARVQFRQVRNELKSKRQESELARDEIEKIRNELKSKRQEIKQIRQEQRAAKDKAERSEFRNREKSVQQEILQLERELGIAKERRVGDAPAVRPTPRAEGEPETGALPDFVVIGGRKCGTTFLYHLLTRHPLVERAAGKELHFFNRSFDEGIEWYRRCFPTPRWKDGRRSITGEATPEYLHHPLAPERMAEVVPQARLIALLRNPVDRAYSDYQMVAKKGRESLTFEEVLGLSGASEAREEWSLGKEGGPPEQEERTSLDHARRKYLSKSIYVDQLLRWSEFFPREQMLVLKSEDFFERPAETLKVVLGFLDLPEWEPKVWELRYRRNQGRYKQEIDPTTRQRLESYFEPHNRRLYDHLGVDFGW